MNLLYRSPNVVVDAHEWHISVRCHKGHVAQHYYFRPLSAKAFKWQPVSMWKGPRPKRLWYYFVRFKAHARAAMDGEAKRLQSIADLNRSRSNGAILANAGQLAA